MVISSSRVEVITKMTDLIVTAKPGFVVDQEKTKYIVNGRRNKDMQGLLVGNYTFQGVTEFKYLETS